MSVHPCIKCHEQAPSCTCPGGPHHAAGRGDVTAEIAARHDPHVRDGGALMGRDRHDEIECPDCEGRGHTEDTRFSAPYGDTIAYGGDAPAECPRCAGTGCVPDPEHECSECHDFGPHVRVIETTGDKPICPLCYHEILSDELRHAADTVQRSDATMIGDLVRSLHGACRDCESTFAKGWRDGLTHALDLVLGLVLDDDARLACAWREATRLGPAVPATEKAGTPCQ